MPGDATEVGAIVAYLSMDRSNWKREIDAAKKDARELGLVDPKIKVTVDGAGKAIAELSTVEAATKRVDNAAKKAGGKDSGMSLLATSLIAIGPAAVPIAGVATGALVGLGAAGATALVGILGIRDAMKQGTPIGHQYQAAFSPLVGEFDHLKQLSAANMFAGINAGAKASQALFPQLNRDVGTYSTQLGQIVGNVGPGLVAILGQLSPLFTTIGGDLVDGSAKFEHWATSSDQIRVFVGYVQNELPKVEQFLGQTATAVTHFAVAFAPLGGGTLSTLTLLLRLLNAIPVDVLTAAAPAITGVVLAVKALKTINASSLPINIGLGAMGPLAIVAGGAIGILSSVLGKQQAAQAHATAEVNSYVSALQASHGAIDQSIRDVAAKNLQDSGAFDAAKKLGIGLDTLTSAALDQGKAQVIVNDLMAQFPDNAYSTIKASGLTEEQYRKLFIAAGTVTNSLGAQNTELAKATQKQKDLAAASQQAAPSQTALAASLASARSALYTDQLNQLNSALDKLSNNSIDAQQQELRLRDAFAAAGTTLKGNGSAINDNTVKGRANQEWVLDQIRAINSHVEAVGKQTGSVEKATGALATDTAQLRVAAAAAGLNKDQVDALIKTYAATPKQVSTTISASTTAAQKKVKELQAQIDALKGRTIIIEIAPHSTLPNGALAGAGKLAQAAGGGTVGGHGGPKADDQLYRLSTGEEVIQQPYASRYRSLLKAINAGTLNYSAPAGKVATGRGQRTTDGSSDSHGFSAVTPRAGAGVQVTQHVYPAQGMDEVGLSAKSARYLARMVA